MSGMAYLCRYGKHQQFHCLASLKKKGGPQQNR